jgi:hypothetical protein
MLLDREEDAPRIDVREGDALCWAATEGHEPVVQLLLERLESAPDAYDWRIRWGIMQTALARALEAATNLARESDSWVTRRMVLLLEEFKSRHKPTPPGGQAGGGEGAGEEEEEAGGDEGEEDEEGEEEDEESGEEGGTCGTM